MKRSISAWKCLVAAFTGTGVGFSMIVLTASLFIEPIQREFALSRAEATIIPLVSLLALPMHTLVGSLVDRIGARKVGTVGLVMLVSVLLAMTQTPFGTLPFYALLLGLAIAGPMTSATVFTKPVAIFFADRPGMAFAITLSGVSVVGAIVIPLITAVIAKHDWRWGYVLLAGTVLLVGLPIVAGWLRMPTVVEVPRKERASLAQVIDDRRLWLLAFGLGIASLPIGGFMGHMQPLLTGAGLDMPAAGRIGSLFAICIGAGRLAAGFLLDRFPAGIVAAVCLSFACVGAFLLGSSDGGAGAVALLPVATALIALAYGAEADFVGYFCLRMFGIQNYSAMFGFVSTFIVMGIGLGGMGFAIGFDLFGNYAAACYVSGGLFLISAAILFALDPGRTEAVTAVN